MSVSATGWNVSPSYIFSVVCVTLAIAAWIVLKRKSGSGKNGPPPSTTASKKLKLPPPTRWVQVGTVDKLIVFPIKSCPGVVVNEAVVTTLGLKLKDYKIRDRDFMLVDTKGKMKAMDKFPQMALIEVTVGGNDEVTLNAPGMDTCTFTYPKYSKEAERVCSVFHDKSVKALDCGDAVAHWFNRYLNKDNLRLNYHHINETQRTFEPYMYEAPLYEQSDMGAFQNETSYLMVAQESINELNRWLQKESSWKNWRPTILIKNILEPFAEVNWSYVRIGSANGILKAAAPCSRCSIVTVDPDMGIMPKDGEPLKTLRSLNRADYIDDKVMAEILKRKGIMGVRMGMYVPAGEGALLRIGDPVYAALL